LLSGNGGFPDDAEDIQRREKIKGRKNVVDRLPGFRVRLQGSSEWDLVILRRENVC
jgi:hypothetical protein